MPTPEEIASEQERLYESSSLRDDINDAEATVLLKWGETQVEHMAQTFPEDFEKKARFLRQLLKNINRFVGQREFNDKSGQREYMEKVVKYLEPLGYTADEETLFAALPDDATDMMANLKAIIETLTPKAAATQPNDTPPTDAPDADDNGSVLDMVTTQAVSDNTEAGTDEEDDADEIKFDTLTTKAVSDERKVTDEQVMPAIPDDEEIEITDYEPNIDKTEVIPDISHLLDEHEQDHNPRDDSYHHNINTTENMPQVNMRTSEIEEIIGSETLENPNSQGINQSDRQHTTGTEDDVTTDE